MAVLLAENVADLVADTLKNLGRGKFTDVSSTIQRHPAMNSLMRKNRVVADGGTGVQFNMLVSQSNGFANVGPLTPDNVSFVDGMIQGSVPWRYSRTQYMIVGQFMAMNSGAAKIVDYIKQQRQMAMINLIEGMETNFWAAPNVNDTLTPYGLPYYVTKNGTTGFNGGILSGYANKAGQSPTTYPALSNYTIAYTDVSRSDLIRSLRKAMKVTDFQPPIEGIPSPNTGNDLGVYTNLAVIQPLEEALEAQNDNLGMDIASMDDKAVLKRRPIVWVPWLDRDTTNPLYVINWGWMKTWILKNWWLKETSVPVTPGLHTVHSQFVDLCYNFLTKNFRCHTVASNGTTYPG